MSTKNPFRTPIVTFNPTGVSQASPSLPRVQFGPSPSPPLPSLPIVDAPSTSVHSSSFRPPTGPPPGLQSSSSTEGSGSSEGERAGRDGSRQQISSDDLNVEAPPAYTPAADIIVGESTLELGPRRPFQEAPVIHPQPHSIQQPWPSQNLNVNGTGGGWQHTDLPPPHLPLPQRGPSPGRFPGGWSTYPDQVPRMDTSSSSSLIPPPRHPQLQSNLAFSSSAPSISTTNLPAPVSDFARDFYAAGTGDGSEEIPRSSSTYSPPESTPPSSSANLYAPPSGPPPTTIRSTGSGGNRVSDDGRPTTLPTPGHPLLLNGKLLVYPNGYECHKCNNIGFKKFDPSHPCRKCWDKYAKPYAGALTYTPWSSNSSTPSNSTTTFQRPLPSFTPPHHCSRSEAHNRSVSNPTLSRAHTQVQPSLSRGPLQNVSPQIHVASPYSLPPPGATIVQPGDYRIGGQLCSRCGGTGLVPFFLFDETTCIACGGVGRIFR